MEIRTYGKQELAQLYFPDADPQCARKHLWRWICRCPQLLARLSGTHLSAHSKLFTPKQVAFIAEFLGEP